MNTFKQSNSKVICFWQLYNNFRKGAGYCPYPFGGFSSKCKHAEWHEKTFDCKEEVKRTRNTCNAMTPTCTTESRFRHMGALEIREEEVYEDYE